MSNNIIFEYNELIQTGKINACYKLKKIYGYIVQGLNNSDSIFYFDEIRARHAIFFIENFCKHSKGQFAGKNIKLELWQLALVSCIFGLVNKETGLRQIRETFLLVARKAGKSLLASAIALYCLLCDEAGAEVVSVATKRDQARIVWDESTKMIRKSPVIAKRTKTLISEIKYNDSTFKPLSADSKSLDGLNVSAAILDEVHEWRDSNLYHVVVDGCAAREQPIVLIISTAGFHREGIFDSKYEQAENLIKKIEENKSNINFNFLPLFYELDSENEYLDENCWIKANPNLGVTKSIKLLKDEVQKVKDQPIFKNNMLCKHFNVRSTSNCAWLTFEQLNNTETFDIKELKPRYGLGGVDISSTTDLTSACLLFQVPGSEKIYFNHMYWLPADLIENRAREDQIPYGKWHEQGLLRLCKGNKINLEDVIDWFIEQQEENDVYLYRCGYDSWGTAMWKDRMIEIFGESTMQEVRQGKKTLSTPMKELYADILAKKIVYNNNPITKWCLSNTGVDVDRNENIQPVKINQRRRIDGFAAMLDAYVVYSGIKNEYKSII